MWSLCLHWYSGSLLAFDILLTAKKTLFLFWLIVSGGSHQIIGNDKISQDIILFAIIEVLLYFVTPLSYEETRCLLKGRISFGQSLTLYGYKCLYINIKISQVQVSILNIFMFVVRGTLFL